MILIIFLERYTEIERENRILLEKMTSIMAHKPKENESNKYKCKHCSCE